MLEAALDRAVAEMNLRPPSACMPPPLGLLRERVVSAIENVPFYAELYRPFGEPPPDFTVAALRAVRPPDGTCKAFCVPILATDLVSVAARTSAPGMMLTARTAAAPRAPKRRIFLRVAMDFSARSCFDSFLEFMTLLRLETGRRWA